MTAMDSKHAAPVKTVGIGLDEATRTKLDEIAQRQQRSRSQVVRMAVSAYDQDERKATK